MDACAPKVSYKKIRCAPKRAACPTCGKKGVRKRTHERQVRTIAYKQVVYLQITVGEYQARCGCCKTFRTCPEGVDPRAKYDCKVRQALLDRLLDDRMSIHAILESLRRDFFLDLSEGFAYDCLDREIRRLDQAEYRRWALEHFSGTLCIDELHLGRHTLLLATDPLNDYPVAFALVSANDQAHMGRFLGNLKRWGFEPDVVVTDGSSLYPALLAELWPDAMHQLCVFHVMMDINRSVLNAVRRLRRQLAQRGKKGRRGKGKAAKRQRAQQRRTLKQQAHFVFKHRYLITQRRDKLSERQRQDLTTMLEYLPELQSLRQFVDDVQATLALDQTSEAAWQRRAQLRRQRRFRAIPELADALKFFDDPYTFAKIVTFLDSPLGKQVRTNNHVERTNRGVRLYEKTRYKWRRPRRIVGFIVLAFDRWRRRRSRPKPTKTRRRPVTKSDTINPVSMGMAA
jgi:hypothetical protein